MTKEELKKEAEEKGREWEHSILPKSEEDYVPYAPHYPYSKGYFAGAEPREKRIAELEEENRALVSGQQLLKETLEKENAELEKDKAYTEGQLDEQIQATLKLQKENAELKKKKEEIEIMTNFCKACKKMHTDQLTKAKEIIREYKNICNNAPFLTEEEVELKEKAEQFLSEVEK